jgi:uncharacterized protein YjcR
MPKARDPKRTEAEQIYLVNGGNIDLVEIAKQLGLPDGTIRGWKSKDKWDIKLNGTLHSSERSKPSQARLGNKNSVGHGAPLGNKNAVGNKGGGAPPENINAIKHGLWAKHLPLDTLELVEALQTEDQISNLRRNIAIQEAAIIRAQSIMNVESKEELIKHLKKQTDGDTSSTREWEFQYAWDRQGNFLSSMARAMTSLTGMHKLLAELQPQGQEKGIKEQLSAFVDALTGTASEVWDDEETEEYPIIN